MNNVACTLCLLVSISLTVACSDDTAPAAQDGAVADAAVAVDGPVVDGALPDQLAPDTTADLPL